MDRKLLKKQLFIISGTIVFFVIFNLIIYMLLTKRLSNNFSGANQMKMVDVAKYLPFEEESDLADIDTDFMLNGELPVLDGAAALVPVYASVIDNIYPKGSVTYEGGVFSDDNYYGENFAANSKMQYQNTIRGFNALVGGKVDVFFCAAPSDEQREYAEKKNAGIEFVPIGLEAFVFFVNKNNSVDDLSAEQIRDIYSGKIKNWSEVGGDNRIINPVTRIKSSGSQSAMEKFMGDAEFSQKSPLAILGGSIGYSFRYYLDGIVDNKNVKMLSLNGVYPDKENVQNRSYPVVMEFYAAYRKDNQNSNIPKLIEWLLSDEGQSLVEKTGYVRINTLGHL